MLVIKGYRYASKGGVSCVALLVWKARDILPLPYMDVENPKESLDKAQIIVYRFDKTNRSVRTSIINKVNLSQAKDYKQSPITKKNKSK